MKLKDSIILILSVVIAIIVGAFVGVKLTENKDDNATTNNGNVEIEKDFSLVEAEKIMSKYGGTCRDYIINLTELEKLIVTFKNTDKTGTKDCDDKVLNGIVYGGPDECALEGSSTAGGGFPIYSYSSILNKKKLLFGSDETVSKTKSIESDIAIHYIDEIDSFVYDISGGCGGDNVATITSAKVINNNLKINVSSTFVDIDLNA